MKSKFITFLFFLDCSLRASAFDLNTILQLEFDTLRGPVKKIVMTEKLPQMASYYNDGKSGDVVTTIYYDSLRRIVKTESIIGKQPITLNTFEYTDSTICQITVSPDEESTKRISYINTQGKPFKTVEYHADTIWTIDSVCYCQYGPLLEYIVNPNRPIKLSVGYKYDDNGRLIKKIDNGAGVQYLYTYESNKIVVERMEKAVGSLPPIVYTFDKMGRLISRKEDNAEGSFNLSYKKYDQYGNWTKRMDTMSSMYISFTTVTTRTIEYYE